MASSYSPRLVRAVALIMLAALVSLAPSPFPSQVIAAESCPCFTVEDARRACRYSRGVLRVSTDPREQSIALRCGRRSRDESASIILFINTYGECEGATKDEIIGFQEALTCLSILDAARSAAQ